MSHTSFPTHLGTFYPAGSGRSFGAGFGALGRKRAANDPIGNTTVTFDGVVAGSVLFIQSQDGSTSLHNSTAPGVSLSVTLPVYASGSPLNDWRIKVRKASAAPFYQPYETLMTAKVGSSSIYVSQIPDE